MNKEVLLQLREDFDEFKKSCRGILLFGSFAQGAPTKRSDIDVCIVQPLEGTLDAIYSKIGGKYDITLFENLPLYIKMEVIEHHEVIYGNELDLSEYFYFFRKLWRDMEHRIRENEFKDFEERMRYRRLWLNEKEKILQENARVSSHFLEHITLRIMCFENLEVFEEEIRFIAAESKGLSLEGEVTRRALLYALEVCVEVVMDTVAMATKDLGLVVEDDYSNLEKLSKEEVMTKGDAQLIRSFNGLRNAIVHKYNHLDLDAIQSGLNKIDELYDVLCKLIRSVEIKGALEGSPTL